MQKFLKVAAIAAISVVLNACGGGAFQSSTNTGTTGTTAAASVAVTSDVTSVPSDGSSGANIKVVVKDATNAPVSGATVAFTADNGGNVTATQGVTDTTGTATGMLVVGTAAAGATITVTATVGSVSGTVKVTVANTQKTLTLLTDLPQIPSDGSKEATITAYVRDANNNLVTGQAVTFTATSGGLAVTRGTTDASGSAVATLNPFGDPTNRTITVTATAGSANATVTVSVIGTKLTLTGPATLVLGTPASTFTAALTNSAGNGIASQTITLTSALGNSITPASFTTDATGSKTFTVNPTVSGSDTITATGEGLTTTLPVAVSNQNFAFTTPAANAATPNIAIGAPGTTVVVTWLSGTTPQVNQTVNFVATRGTPSTFAATTNAQGQASYTLTSTTAGPSLITATGVVTTGTAPSTQTTVNFIATTPASLSLQPSPSTVPVQGQSTLTATVRDAAGNLVANKLIDFTLTDTTGGSLSAGSVTTDSGGQAQVVYTAGTTTSANNGVSVKATVDSAMSVFGTTTLTVAGQTVFLDLGTGNTIVALDQTQYSLPYSVRAHDQAGHGVNNVTVSFQVISLGYMKGVQVYGAIIPNVWDPVPTHTPANDANGYQLLGLDGCVTEDTQHDGILAHANDYNGDGKIWPGTVVNTDVLNALTGTDGYATVNLIYAKDHAKWVAVRLLATATVSGTETTTSRDFWLPGLSADYTSQSQQPPGYFSPYGAATACSSPN
jgi:hypothetical protein